MLTSFRGRVEQQFGQNKQSGMKTSFPRLRRLLLFSVLFPTSIVVADSHDVRFKVAQLNKVILSILLFNLQRRSLGILMLCGRWVILQVDVCMSCIRV